MVEKLRKKFILISVSAVFVVVFIIALSSNLANYAQIERNADELLDVLVENDGYFPKKVNHDFEFKLPPKMSPEAPFSTRFFTVKTDNQGNIFEVDTGKISAASNEQALKYANNVLNSKKTSGFIDDYKYKIANKEYGLLIVFVDVGRDLQIFYSFLRSSLIIGSIAIIAVFIIVLIFSKRAIAPIAESYEKQKQFITDAGHELRTPLAIISTNTDVLEIENGENQWTKSIHNQVLRLSNLVESLVSLTRMDEEKNQLTKKNFSLSDLVLGTAEQFQELSKSYDKDLVLNIEKGISYYGDEQSIILLTSILLDNALKYALKGSSISISLNKLGKHYILQTINQADDLNVGSYDIFFERFYRSNSSRNSKSGGYGIGLSLAKSIVLKHKGKIKAESLDGKTIIFSVQLQKP